MRKAREAMAGIVGLGVATARRLGGDLSRYEIAAGYKHRDQAKHYDATANADEWQKEVYEAARFIMTRNDLRTVYDVGCGSGYKLVHILGQFETIGIDVPETIEVVRRIYPERKWIGKSFDSLSLPEADIVICSDVIEHVPDPDALMRFLVNCTKQWIVLSTPDRDLIYKYRFLHKSYFGPPKNPTHMREWTKAEFSRYVRRFARIIRHEVSNRKQATQLIIAEVIHLGS
jgi:SAM-dependent methyltransferase